MLKTKTTTINLRIDPELKEFLTRCAEKKGMDLAKLTRAILANYRKPRTYDV